MCAFRLPPRSRWDLRSSGILTQCIVVIPYGSLGAACRSHIQRVKKTKEVGCIDPWNMGPTGPETSVITTYDAVFPREVQISKKYSDTSASRVTVLTNFSANEDFLAFFLDTANEYGFG